MSAEHKCQNCGHVGIPNLEESGPHTKALCNECGGYIKFLNAKELVAVLKVLKGQTWNSFILVIIGDQGSYEEVKDARTNLTLAFVSLDDALEARKNHEQWKKISIIEETRRVVA